VKEDIDKEPGHSVGLKQVSLLKCRSRDEVATVSGVASAGSGQCKAPQRLKPLGLWPLYRSAEGAAPPKGRKMLAVSQFGTARAYHQAAVKETGAVREK
jgi:hypothetical protein